MGATKERGFLPLLLFPCLHLMQLRYLHRAEQILPSFWLSKRLFSDWDTQLSLGKWTPLWLNMVVSLHSFYKSAVLIMQGSLLQY